MYISTRLIKKLHNKERADTGVERSSLHYPHANPTANPHANTTAHPHAKPTANPRAKPTANPCAKPTANPNANPFNTPCYPNSCPINILMLIPSLDP